MKNRFLDDHPKAQWEDIAISISKGETPVSDADIPALLEWCQDGNWPGFHHIVKFLPSFGEQLLHPLRVILSYSSDELWSYWIICFLLPELDTPLLSKLRPTLHALRLKHQHHDAEGLIEKIEQLLKDRFNEPRHDDSGQT